VVPGKLRMKTFAKGRRWYTGHQRPTNRVLVLLVHRLHDGAYDPSKERTAACAANRIAEKAAQRPTRSRISTRSTPKKATKKCTASDTADGTANYFGQLAQGYLLQHRPDSLTTENSSNDLNNNRKK
jgi:hypothetical protein